MKKLVSALLTALLAASYAPWAVAQSSTSSRPIDAKERAALFPTAASIEQGRALVEASCAACHGLNGVSLDDHQPNLAGQRTVYLYRETLAYKNGTRTEKSMNDAVAFLDEDALLKTAIYYASLTPPFDREAAVAAQGSQQKIDDDPLLATKSATAGCGSCHGTSGNSTVPGMPSLTAQHPEYFATSMKAYQSGDRTDNMMQMLVAALDEETINNMGIFYALQEPAKKAAAGPGDPVAGGVAGGACASCHGADGNAAGDDMPTLAGQDSTYLVKAMKTYIDGQREHGPMQAAMAGASEDDIDDMAAFYSMQDPVARTVRKPLTAAEWLNRCNRCHGANGNSTDPRYSRLSGQNKPYLVDMLKAYANGERSDSVMHAMSAPLTDGIIERLAVYYSSQEPRSVVYFELPCNDGEDK